MSFHDICNPRKQYEDNLSKEDAFDVDVGRDDLRLVSVNSVDDECGQKEESRCPKNSSNQNSNWYSGPSQVIEE